MRILPITEILYFGAKLMPNRPHHPTHQPVRQTMAENQKILICVMPGVICWVIMLSMKGSF
jgi:hypothetical protein